MKPNIPAEQTIRLASENPANLAFFTELTGLPADELVNWLRMAIPAYVQRGDTPNISVKLTCSAAMEKSLLAQFWFISMAEI
jgi:hypothetical protein